MTDELDITTGSVTIRGATGGAKSQNSLGTYIVMGSNIAGSIFKFSAASNVAGCSVIDLLIEGAARAYTCTSAIEIVNCDNFSMRNVRIREVQGTALGMQRMVKGYISDLDVIQCGAASKPAIWVHGSGGSDVVQASTFIGIRVEHCYATDYFKIESGNHANKIIGLATEASTADVDDTGYPFLNIASGAIRTHISTAHFNANTGATAKDKVVIAGDQTTMSNCVWNGTIPTGGLDLNVTGDHFVGSDFNFYGLAGDEGKSIATFAGDYATVDNVTVRLRGGITVTGSHNIIKGWTLRGPNTARVVNIAVGASNNTVATFSANACGTSVTQGIYDQGTNSLINGVRLSFSAGGVAQGIEIASTSTYGIYTNNFIRDCGKNGIYCNGAGDPSEISNNVIRGYDEGNTGTYSGILMAPGTTVTTGGVMSGNVVYADGGTVEDSIRFEDTSGGLTGNPAHQYWAIIGNNARDGLQNGSFGAADGGNNIVTGNVT